MAFTHLRVRSEFSLLNSVIRVNDIANWAASERASAVGLMDDMSLSGALSFSTNLIKKKVKPIIGMNVFIHDGRSDPNKYLPYIGLIAQNEHGYRSLLSLLYHHGQEKNMHNQNYIELSALEHIRSNIICITGGNHGFIADLLLQEDAKMTNKCVTQISEIFGDRLYVEITRHGMRNESQLESSIIDLAESYNLPLVATNDVRFYEKRHFQAYDVITCIADNTTIYEKKRRKFNDEYYLKSIHEMEDIFSDIPEAIMNTEIIAKRCSFAVEPRPPALPQFISDSGLTSADELTLLSRKKLQERISTNDAKYQEYEDRLMHELNIINNIGFAGYFLVVHDFISWSRNNNVAFGPGRGSGAGSLVAWSIGVTKIDPMQYGLLFERFLNPDRISMPDFDIDFCQIRRDEVINYVKDRYGFDKVASIATFGTLQARAVIKDIGRVMAMPYKQVDNICKIIPFNPVQQVTLKIAIESDSALQAQRVDDPEIGKLLNIATDLEGLHRHVSTHAAGIVIANQSILDIAPIKKDNDDPKKINTLCINMKDAEKLGFIKFDFLGLRTITLIDSICAAIKHHDNIDIDIDSINLDDQKTFELLRSGSTFGIFQLEASVPRSVMRAINVSSILDIAAITSLNRPGPMSNIPTYIARKLKKEEISYQHPLLKEILEETYGIIVYQEQVMAIARILANYTLAAADIFRRAMGKKDAVEMDAQRALFLAGCSDNGISSKISKDIFELLAKFAGYGFNKSHAVAYSIISYQTAYLKANYPIEFFIGSLNLDIEYTDKILQIISDVKINKIPVCPPCINYSSAKFIAKNGSIVYALGAIKSLGIKASESIVTERENNGLFLDIFDFAKRCGKYINKKNIEYLIKANSFSILHKNTQSLVKALDRITDYIHEKKVTVDQDNLFSDSDMFSTSSIIFDEDIPCSQKDLAEYEFASMGFYLQYHALSSYVDILKKHKISVEYSLKQNDIKSGKNELIVAGTISAVKHRVRNDRRFAFVHVLDLYGSFELMIFNDHLIEEKRHLLVDGCTIVAKIKVKYNADTGSKMIIDSLYDIDEFIQLYSDSAYQNDNKTNNDNINVIDQDSSKLILREPSVDIGSVNSRSIAKNDVYDTRNPTTILRNNVLFLDVNTVSLSKIMKLLQTTKSGELQIVLKIGAKTTLLKRKYDDSILELLEILY